MEEKEPLALGVTTNANRDLFHKENKLSRQCGDDFSDLQLRELSQNSTPDEVMSQESRESKMEILSQESVESKMEFSSQESDTSKMDYTNLSEDNNTPEVMLSNADSSNPEGVLKNAEADKGKCSESSTRKRKASETKIANSMQQNRELEKVLTLRQEALMKREKAVLFREMVVSKHESAVSEREDILRRILDKKNPKRLKQ